MTIRQKALLVGITVLIFSGLAIAVTSNTVLTYGFTELEANDMHEELGRIGVLLRHELNTLSATAADWAERDTTYRFMADGDPAYIESHLSPRTFVNLDVDALFLLDTDGDVFLRRGVDPASGYYVSVPARLDALLDPDDPLNLTGTNTTRRAGFVRFGSHVFMVAANAILDSNRKGPARGTLIWVRRLDDRATERMSSIFGLNIDLILWGRLADDLPDEALAQFEAGDGAQAVVAGVDSVIGYQRIDGITGNPVAVLRVEAPRSIVAYGARVTQMLVVVLMAGGVVSLIGIVVAINRFLLNRMLSLTAVVTYVRDTGDLAADIREQSKDEIGELAQGIRSMLGAVRAAHEAVRRTNAALEERVTERTVELRQSKDDVEVILANTSDMIVQVDAAFCMQRVNRAFEHMLGYAPDAVLSEPFVSVVRPDDRRALDDLLHSVTETQTVARADLTVQRYDGTTFDAEIALSSVFDESGELRSVIAVLRDVTARKAAERQQAQMITGLRRVLSLSGDLITAEDTDSLCRKAVEILRAGLGLERCAIFLEVDDVLVGTYGTDGRGILVDERAQRLTMSDSIWHSRQKLLDREGARWMVSDEDHFEWDGQAARVIGHGWVAITPIMGTRGFVGILLNDTAITHAPVDVITQELASVFCTMFGAIYENKQAEESVRKALDRQMELNTLKERFVSMVSHEFRTPLAVIQTSTDILRRYSDRISEERRTQYLDETERQVQHMKDLMEDYLTLDRADRGQIRLDETPVDVVALCRTIIHDMQLVFPQRVILLESPLETCTITLDSAVFQQAISNLISNAVKYSQAPSVVNVRLACDGDRLVLSVRDQGIGIPADDLKRVFDIFHRGSNVDGQPGTGLGLAIVKRAVEAHQGTVAVDSVVGVGTAVTLTLPVAPPRILSSAERQHAP